MKRFYLNAVLLLLLTACSKNDFPAPPPQAGVAPISQNAAPGAWETPAAWTQTGAENGFTRFSTTRSLEGLSEELIGKGLVLVYAEGYNVGGPALRKPLGLPFQMMGAGDATLQWEVDRQPGRVTVSVLLPDAAIPAFQAGRDAIRLRYLLLSPEAVAATGHSAMELRNLPYAQVTGLVRVAP